MEQTLGKRIMEHRKRLGLTQDALAEKLGITAQAISKWENDLSCPDIAMLPRLAEIFGITTDELLGMEAKTKVHQAEVVDENEDDFDEGIFNLCFNSKEDDGKWTFHWDSGRKHAVGFACWVLGFGVLLLANNLCDLNASFWSLAWPSWLLMMGLVGGKKFSFTQLGFVLLGGYFLVNNLGFMPFELGGEIIWPGLVILFGLSLLTDALRKPKKPKFSVTHKGGNSGKTTWNCRNTTDGFVCELAFGENHHMVDVPVLAKGEATVNFGELTIDLSGCGCVAEDCRVEATCAFGSLDLLVPKCFAVQCDNATVFASVDISGQPDPCPQGVIHLDATANFGEIDIHYI